MNNNFFILVLLMLLACFSLYRNQTAANDEKSSPVKIFHETDAADLMLDNQTNKGSETTEDAWGEGWKKKVKAIIDPYKETDYEGNQNKNYSLSWYLTIIIFILILLVYLYVKLTSSFISRKRKK